MSKIRRDFEFLSEILKEFVNQKSFIKKLQLMYETDISGWEIWLQVELALFFQGHEKIADWNREDAIRWIRGHLIAGTMFPLTFIYVRNIHMMRFLWRLNNTKNQVCAFKAWGRMLGNLALLNLLAVPPVVRCGVWGYMPK